MELTKKQIELLLDGLFLVKQGNNYTNYTNKDIEKLDGMIRYASSVACLDTSETIADKYEIITCEKEDSLGEIMTLKEALDLYWNRINFTIKKDGTCTDFAAYKKWDGSYEIWDTATDDCYNNDDKLLNTKIELDCDWYNDGDNFPIISAEVVEA